jgi:hypothetical protein
MAAEAGLLHRAVVAVSVRRMITECVSERRYPRRVEVQPRSAMQLELKVTCQLDLGTLRSILSVMRTAAIALFQTALAAIGLYWGHTEFLIAALFMVLFSIYSLRAYLRVLMIAHFASNSSKSEVMLEAIWRQVGVRPALLNSIADDMHDEIAAANLCGEFGLFNTDGHKLEAFLQRNIDGWKRGWSRFS